MPIGPSNAVWRRLSELLGRLAIETHGAVAFVVDEGNGLWCTAGGTELAGRNYSDIADAFYRDVIAPRASELRRGGRIAVVKVEGEERYVAESFAGIYVLVIWFAKDFDPFRARAKLREVLPEIERLVVSLPPDGGPAGNEGARRLT